MDLIWVDNLIKIMEYENRLQIQMLKISADKTAAIVAGNLQVIQELLPKEQKYSEEMLKLEDAREKVMVQIAADMKLDPKTMKVSDMIERLNPKYSAALDSARKKLDTSTRTLIDKNNLNNQLIQNSLDYINFMMNLVIQPIAQPVHYGRTGQETSQETTVRRFDSRY